MAVTVVVVGGGYGGSEAAKALDDVADVVLVDPREAFVHNIALLRGLVDPQWTDRVFYPYETLLDRGTFIQDQAVRVDAGSVTLGSGERIAADYVVLATGSTYPYPAKIDVNDVATAKGRIRATREALAAADRALLLGAGPVGLELAGEIKTVWPNTHVTIVDPLDHIVAGPYDDGLRAELHRQLDALDVELVLGTTLESEPPSAPATTGTFTVTTRSGTQITADIWFRCFGVVPVSDYLVGELASARTASGQVEVTPELRVVGQERVFAIGDITAIAEPKRGGTAGHHAKLVAGNIRALITGDGELAAYEPSPPLILVPLGPHGGASQLPGMGVIGAETTAQYKGQDLFSGRYAELFGQA